VSAAAAALRDLALRPTAEARKRAWISLLRLSHAATGDVEQRFGVVLEEAWDGVREDRAALVQALALVVQTDPSLLTIELAAWALAVEGEDGATELLSLARHRDFSIRSKVAIGFAMLGRRARWAVPALIRALEHEPVDYVARCLLRTLGIVGGPEAIQALERIISTNWELADAAREALAACEREGQRDRGP
jgi:hypothetical protein